jgi:hypothetical protein
VFPAECIEARLAPARAPAVFLLLFASAMVYVRCDFVLSRDDKWRAEQDRQRLGYLAQLIAGVLAGGVRCHGIGRLSDVWQVGCGAMVLVVSLRSGVVAAPSRHY